MKAKTNELNPLHHPHPQQIECKWFIKFLLFNPSIQQQLITKEANNNYTN